MCPCDSSLVRFFQIHALVLTERWLLLFLLQYVVIYCHRGSQSKGPTNNAVTDTLPDMDNLKCVLPLERHLRKSYTVPQDNVGKEWTYWKTLSFSLYLLDITHQEKDIVGTFLRATTNLGAYSTRLLLFTNTRMLSLQWG